MFVRTQTFIIYTRFDLASFPSLLYIFHLIHVTYYSPPYTHTHTYKDFFSIFIFTTALIYRQNENLKHNNTDLGQYDLINFLVWFFFLLYVTYFSTFIMWFLCFTLYVCVCLELCHQKKKLFIDKKFLHVKNKRFSFGEKWNYFIDFIIFIVSVVTLSVFVAFFIDYFARLYLFCFSNIVLKDYYYKTMDVQLDRCTNRQLLKFL